MIIKCSIPCANILELIGGVTGIDGNGAGVISVIKPEHITVDGFVVSWAPIKNAVYQLESNLWIEPKTISETSIDMSLYLVDDKTVVLTILPIVPHRKTESKMIVIEGEESGVGYYVIGRTFKVRGEPHIGIGYFKVGFNFIVK